MHNHTNLHNHTNKVDENSKNGTNLDVTQDNKKKNIYMWIGICGCILIILIVKSVVICIYKKGKEIKVFSRSDGKISCTKKKTQKTTSYSLNSYREDYIYNNKSHMYLNNSFYVSYKEFFYLDYHNNGKKAQKTELKTAYEVTCLKGKYFMVTFNW